MKKTATYLTLSSLMIGFLMLSSCKEKPQKFLVQRWKIEDVKISEEVPAEQKEFFNEMLKQMKQYLRITYREDGTYEANMMGNISKGKWELSEDGKTLTASDESNKPMTYKIISLSKDKFEYKTSDSLNPVTFTLVPGDSVTNVAPEMMNPGMGENPHTEEPTVQK